MLQIFALPMNMKVVDEQLFNWTALPAVVVLKDEMLKRARRSGRHVAESLKKPIEEAEYIGPQGVCPVCHTKVVELDKTSGKVICATCGVSGTLKTDGDTYALEVTEEDRAHSHVLLSGKFQHGDDLKNISLKPDPRMGEIPELKKKYKEYLSYSKPERTEDK
jgi:uncharacterized Zn finger protein (UPF0148 family)